MIITCPNCSARYRVNDELIKAKGKRVKCKKCTAVFVAFPDRDAVLEQAPEDTSPAAAAPAPAPQPAPKPPAPAAMPADAPQATVKVDRSQLDKFLQNNTLDGTQSTLKVDPGQFQNMMKQQAPPAAQAAGATVQVDRSKIDAFLQQGRPPVPAPPPGVNPGATDTVALDPAAVSSMMQGLKPQQAPPAPEPAAAPEPEEPRFPSDEELGITDGPDDAFDTPAEPPQATPAPAAPAPPPPAPPVAEALYQADVEGNIYPNLRTESIARWIREGRLLENDMIAPNGTKDYRAAGTYPEFEAYFREQEPMEHEAEPVKKKGFFAKLFSFGK